jgi:hypothetical protein
LCLEVGVRSLLFSTEDIIFTDIRCSSKMLRNFAPMLSFTCVREQALDFGNNNKKSSNFVLINRVIHKVRQLGSENGQFQGIGGETEGEFLNNFIVSTHFACRQRRGTGWQV